MPGTIALFASSRRNGNTGHFLDRIAGELKIEVVDLAEKNISAYDYWHDNRGDDFEPLMARVLECDHIIFSSPIYWYSVSPAMKVFLDRISDYLEIPELMDEGRKLRGKTGYVVCTSVYDRAASQFVGMFEETFKYLGMNFGGLAHIDCRDGYHPDRHEAEALGFVQRLRSAQQP